MNINGSNTLACITPVTDETVVFPLTQMPILRDLVVDFRWFFKQVELVQNSTPKPNKVCFSFFGSDSHILFAKSPRARSF